MTNTKKVKEGDFLLVRLDEHSPVLTEIKVLKKIGDQVLKVTKLYSGGDDDDLYIDVAAANIFTDKGVRL